MQDDGSWREAEGRLLSHSCHQSAGGIFLEWPIKLGQRARKTPLTPLRAHPARSTGAFPDGRIEIDSNIVERAIRPQTITRKNSLFAGSEGGGRTWATLATLLQAAKMNKVDPLEWLSQTLTRIAKGWPVSELEALMPWNFKPDAIG